MFDAMSMRSRISSHRFFYGIGCTQHALGGERMHDELDAGRMGLVNKVIEFSLGPVDIVERGAESVFPDAMARDLAARWLKNPREVQDLAEVQKEIIVATWKLDRQDVTDRVSADLATVADAQEELKWAAQRATERMWGWGRASTPGRRGLPSPETQAMRDALARRPAGDCDAGSASASAADPPDED